MIIGAMDKGGGDGEKSKPESSSAKVDEFTQGEANNSLSRVGEFSIGRG